MKAAGKVSKDSGDQPWNRCPVFLDVSVPPKPDSNDYMTSSAFHKMLFSLSMTHSFMSNVPQHINAYSGQWSPRTKVGNHWAKRRRKGGMKPAERITDLGKRI